MALILVLGFIALLTGLLVAFLTLALSNRVVASASASQTKTELLTRGALQSVLEDLKQEIAAGSSRPAPPLELLVPNAAGGAAPARVGSDDMLPNLLKRSAFGQPFFSGAAFDSADYPPSNRAAYLPSDKPTRDGRFISRKRWNEPLLLPGDAAAAGDPQIPRPEFSVPDWILVAPDGSNPKEANGSVLGRYAYAIYDEGGLLDANVAGHPLGKPVGAVPKVNEMTPGQAIEVSRKGALGFADLTQIGLTRLQADQMVGWRNYASTQPDGALPALRFDGDSARKAMDRYNSFILKNETAFLLPPHGPLYRNQTDRNFSSRQELQRFLLQGVAANASQRGKLQNALQFLGTFSRDLNAPFFHPDSARPRIAGTQPAQSSPLNYTGNNDSQNADDKINPSILSIRVGHEFTREGGALAKTGEPLVSRRFPLERLAQIHPETTGREDIRSTLYRQFGLSRSRADQPWRYQHGFSGIARLEEVAALVSGAREPDFVELLKAAICAGSLGKSAATDGLAGAYAHRRDIALDYQVLQIFANILDQYDADSLPTRIVLAAGHEVRGIENLPYLYRYRVGCIQARLPVPMGSGAWGPANTKTPLSDPGLGVFLFLPELWNPHDQNSAQGSPAPRDFRLLMDAHGDPGDFTGTGDATVHTHWVGAPGEAVSVAQPLSAASSELLFNLNSESEFREPTLMGRTGTSSHLRAGPSHSLRKVPGADAEGAIADVSDKAANPPRFLGALLGSFSLRSQIAKPTGGTTTLSAGKVSATLSSPTLSVRLQYRDTGGRWITYDDKAIAVSEFVSELNGAHPGVPPGANGFLPGQANSWGQCSDPRTFRFGIANGIGAPAQLLDPISATLRNSRADRGAGAGTGQSGLPGMGMLPRPGTLGALGWGPVDVPVGPASVWRSGLLSQNRPDVIDDARLDGTVAIPKTSGPIFYADADKVIRRAMAAYVPSGGGWSGASEIGVPQVTSTRYPQATPSNRSLNRPIMLNRPFRSVAELGCVFRDLPWKQLDFFTPESGDGALLDIFCLREDTTPDALVAGRLNLNTRQVPVLKAVLAEAYRDEIAALPAPAWTRTTLGAPSGSELEAIAKALVERTSDPRPNRGPLRNVSELVGKFVPGYRNELGQPFDGFSADLAIYTGGAAGAPNVIQRFRDTAMRALADVGTTRVWNLLIDLIVQTGRYPLMEKDAANFIVEGEERVWFHVAIDRWTGKVIASQLEPVHE